MCSLSPEVAIEVRGVGKCYEIYDKPHHRLWQTLHRGKKRFYREFWALRDVSLEVCKGECVGIVGRNGSGKSTLLQIVAGTLHATEGEVGVNGRVSALLELGSGFNPEFTGRENVYMNGLLLGLSRREVDSTIHSIEAFADIGEFMDQPVKTYSSGMLVRLAFAVYTQARPDILIVDEALAVGDAAFQMKCMSHMQKLVDRGTTVLFVSHSVQTVRAFCSRALWLEHGSVRMFGDVQDVTNRYMEFLFAGEPKEGEGLETISDGRESAVESPRGGPLSGETSSRPPLVALEDVNRTEHLRRWGSGEVLVSGFRLDGAESGMSGKLEHLEEVTVVLEMEARKIPDSREVSVAFSLRNNLSMDIVAYSTCEDRGFIALHEAGEKHRVQFRFSNILVPGDYMLALAVEHFSSGAREYCDFVENAYLISVVSSRRHYGIVEPAVEVSYLE